MGTPIPSPSANPVGLWRLAMVSPLRSAAVASGRPQSIASFGFVLVLLGGVAALTWFLGSANPFTPAGYVGYLTKGAIVGKSRFYGVQRGPTSAGRTWLLDVTN